MRPTARRSRAFVGWGNFSFVIKDPDFHRALWNTTIFAVFSICLQLPLSLGLAMLLNAKNDRLKGIFRLAIFAPNLVGQVFVGIIFSVLFAPHYGLLNVALHALVGWGLEEQWLGNPQLVMPAIIIAAMWMYVGFNMIYFLAALQNVDQSLIEAARIDGAGPAGFSGMSPSRRSRPSQPSLSSPAPSAPTSSSNFLSTSFRTMAEGTDRVTAG